LPPSPAQGILIVREDPVGMPEMSRRALLLALLFAASLYSPGARILHPQRSSQPVLPRRNRLTTPFLFLPLAMIPTGACASD